MSLPLIILAIFSIYFGFLTKDIFIGIGSGFFIDNSIFIHPMHEILINTEFGVPSLFKLLPLILTIIFSLLSLIIFETLTVYLQIFKFSKIGYYIFGFFNQRFLIEMFYNKYIVNTTLMLGGQTTKILDKGSIELIGPYGLEKILVKISKFFNNLSTGIVTTYALYILIGILSYFLIYYFLNLNLINNIEYSNLTLILFIYSGIFTTIYSLL
jgi:NADH-ubiquinone oxidoreductase chain 5